VSVLAHDPPEAMSQDLADGEGGVFVLPASYGQQRLWFLDQLEPGSPLYNVPLALRLRGPLDAGALEWALGEIVRRHETLRTTLASEEGEVVQVVAPQGSPGSWVLPRHDLADLAPGWRREEARRLLDEVVRRPFDLQAGPLFRGALLRLGAGGPEAEHVLCLTLHHAVADGWSLGVLQRELEVLYRARLADRGGQPEPLPELPIQYADYVVWQREQLQGELLERQLAWWREQLADAPRVAELPLARPRPAVRTYRGAWRTLSLPREVLSGLQALARRAGVTRFMALLAAFDALLYRYTGQTELVVGTPSAGREQIETEGLIGFFANTLALRTSVAGEPTFRELVARVREAFLGAHAHQDLPFERLVEELQPQRDLSHAPIVQVLFTFREGSALAAPTLLGLRVEPLEVHTGQVKFDLALSVEEAAGALVARLDYDEDLLGGAEAARLLAHFRTLLAAALAAPELPVPDLPLFTAAEHGQLLLEWNDTAAAWPRDRCLHEMVEAQAARTPGATAVIDGGSRLSYRELERRANRLANRLRRLGIGAEARVGIALERSAALPVALLAVLKAGGAYVPLDPAYPRERLAFILADAQEGQAAPVLLSERRVLDRLPPFAGTVVLLDEEGPALAAESDAAPADCALPDSLAYLIYTSGSTGQPKGVAIEHRSAVALMHWSRESFRPAELAGVLASTSICFDMSVFELFAPLAWGGTVILAENALALPSLPARGEVTLVDTVPSAMAELLRQGAFPPAVKTVNLGGEPLQGALARQVHATGTVERLLNLYGPSEDTTFSTIAEVGPEGEPTIGRILTNGRGYVLDRSLRPQPVAVPGDLYLGGEGLARGYLGRPRLTAERFVPDPFGGPGERLYRTGDLVRRRPDGELEFLGRFDHQVKIRGFRVELGEIEAALLALPGVREAVVMAREDLPGEQRVVAYLAPELPAGLRERLRERLPDYMIPAAFVVLPRLPLTPNGKVDRRALPAPEWEAKEAGWVAPRTPAEELLAGIWSNVLRIGRVGVHDDFFSLGGHSLLATQVVSRVREVCAVELPLRRLFEGPTVAELARQVEAARRAEAEPAQPSLVPVPRDPPPPASFAQERLWFLDRFGAGGAPFHLPQAFRMLGRLDVAALRAALDGIVSRHEVLRTAFALAAQRVVQRVAPELRLPVPVVDLAALPALARAAEAEALTRREASRPFDLSRLPLARAALLRRAPEEHELLLTFHHIVFDGWSAGILLGELSELYLAAVEGRAPRLPELPVQYADFAAWQREWLQGEALERQLAFWRQRLAGAPAVLELPTDRPRPAVLGLRGAWRRFEIPAVVVEGLRALCRRRGATLFMAVLAAFQTLLARVTGGTDVSVGSPIAGRTRLETEGLIGLFINMLVLRTDLAGDPAFEALLQRVRATTLEAYDHQDVPFEKLVEELRPQRDTAHTPLFQVMLILQNTPRQRLECPDLEVGSRDVDLGTAKFDLNVSLWEVGGEAGLIGTAEYNRDLFDPPTIDRLFAGFATLLGGIAADPARVLSELPLLPEPARQQAVREWNDTVAPYPRDLCLHHPFESQAARAPEALAVVAGEERLTYGELDRRANQLAWLLRSRGVGPGTLVAVYLGRGPEMVVAVLAVHKADGAYVPVETVWPPERVHGILAGQEIAHLITGEAQLASIDAMPPLPVLDTVVCLDLPAGSRPAGPPAVLSPDDLERLPAERPPASAGPDDLAYIIFTSGSTGKPKGVVVRHRPAVNLVDWVNRTFGVGPADRLLLVANLSFDLSVYDIYGILAAGGSIRIASSAEQRDAQALARILCREPITFWDSAPAALQQLVPFFPPPGSLPHAPALRLVFLSGDWIPVTLPDKVRESFSRARVIGLGGATEATIWSNFYPVGRVDPAWASIPYGRPIQNARYHVLDAALGPCPVGVAGDLYIGGDDCLSSGYAGEPGMTAGKYLPDPFAAEPGARMYRTGDRARYGPDGNLEFLGRVDTQVKVRGYRIELGEIEAVLAAHPAVREAVVLARQDTPGDQRLVAYLIADFDPPPSALELRRFAQRKLPDYMVPSAFLWRRSWPVSTTGKLDRKALPPPETAGAAEPEEGSFEAPRNELERTIAAIWCDVIGRERVSVRESFFDAGGHSLLMARAHTRLQEALGRPIPLVDLFQYPTVESLARHLNPPETAGDEAGPLLDRRTAAAFLSGAIEDRGMAIAVIGMAGRFPGAANVEELWRNLRDGVESIRFFTEEELRVQGFPPRLLEDPHLVRARGAIDGPDLFDAAFFDYAPREAQIMDPQQRLFLECAWEAMEHAGYGADDDRRGRVGVYAGVTENTYVLDLYANLDLVRTLGRQQIAIANNHDYLPTRVSYKLNLRGPSVNVQTACSTSLVAVHLACRSLLHGECDLAMAGGVSVQAREVAGYLYHEGGISSPDGHTRAFDADAQGVVSGSGAGIVVLKRLADALADGDTVHAVLRGSASNNDGAAKVGFTAPSVEGQTAAIREALRVAAVDPATIDYVEAHGTGTPLGDPIEVAALTQAFGGAGEGPRCALGSIKTNIGHLDAASGVAGLIKTVLALRERTIPASLHFRRPNPGIAFGPFFVNTRTREWPASEGRPRRAGVSSFGIGGTNAHVVLEETPLLPAGDPPRRPKQLLVLSAKTATALEAATARLAAHLETHPEMGDDDLADVSYTLQLGRQPFRHRRALAAGGREDAVAALRSLDSRWVTSGSPASGERTLAFLFPGQGAQYLRMGEGLYRSEPAFHVALDRCCELLLPDLGFDLRGVLYPPPGEEQEAERRLRQTAVTQPALFAVEYALARLWMDWGVRPAAMIGHSIGEYVAACLADVFSLEDGLRLVAARGRLIQELPEGAMAALPLSEEEARRRLAAYPELSLAAVNSPRACVVSGPSAAVEELSERLRGEGLEIRRLHTSHAFHSAMMEPVLDAFASLVRGVDLRPPRLPYLSNLTGTWVTPEQATDPAYWVHHLREPVRFAEGAGELFRRPGPILLEVGPGRTLATLARQCSPKGEVGRAILTSLGGARGRRPDAEAVLDALGRLWVEGVEVDWPALHAGERRRRVPLPAYPFERSRHWLDTAGREAAAAPARPAETPRAEAAELGPLERQVARVFQELLGVERAAAHDDFFSLGGSSLMAVQLGARLREVLQVELSADVLLETSTVRGLAALAAESRGAGANGGRPRSSLVRLQAGAAGRRPLFMVHQVGGHVFTFRALARSLGADRPFYGLRSRGLEEGEEPLGCLEQMASHYLDLIREVQPSGPYLIGGASMGGMVAFEMAQRLRAAGEEVALLALLDTPCADQMPARPVDDAEFVDAVFAGRVALSREELAGLTAEEQLAHACAKARASDPSGGLDLPEARRLFRVLQGNVAALFDYAPRPYPGRLLFFRARQRRPNDPPRPEIPWIELAEHGIEIVLAPGDHETMHVPPNVEAIAERLASHPAMR
jgi:amino acid adenylation domain-containing protein